MAAEARYPRRVLVVDVSRGRMTAMRLGPIVGGLLAKDPDGRLESPDALDRALAEIA